VNTAARAHREGLRRGPVVTFTTAPGLQTLPLWIFDNLFRPDQAPVINVVAVLPIVVSIIPIWAAQRLPGSEGGAGF
jgi:putative spermidine/putrescine transport system permease protein